MQEKNLGYIKNFEFLLGKVESEIYALADQDDIWMDNKLEAAIEKLEETNADLYFSDLILIDEEENEISKSFWKEKGFYNKIHKDKNYNGLLLNNYITGCTIVSKSMYIKDIIPFPDNTKYLVHDYWIAIILSNKGKIVYDNTAHIKYRQHENNQVGSKMKSKELKSFNEVRNLFIDVKLEHFRLFIKNRGLFSEKLQKQNEEALAYYERLGKIKNINFRYWILFYKLYKYENFKYYIANFVILNIPILGRIIYKIKKG